MQTTKVLNINEGNVEETKAKSMKILSAKKEFINEKVSEIK